MVECWGSERHPARLAAKTNVIQANIIEEDGVQRQGSKRQGQGDLELVPTRLAMSTPYFYNPRQTRGYAMTNWLQGTSVPRPSPHPHPRPMSISNIALVFEPMCACV